MYDGYYLYFILIFRIMALAYTTLDGLLPVFTARAMLARSWESYNSVRPSVRHTRAL